MSNQRQYEKVSGGSNNNRWEPHKEKEGTYSEQNPAIVEGYYSQISQQSGPNGPFNVHEIQTLDENGNLGDAKDLSLGVGLDNTLTKIPIGTWVCVKFKGKKVNPKNNRTFNDTEVFQDRNAIPYQEMLSKGAIVTKAIPASNTNAVSNATKTPASNNPFPEDDDQLPF